ncbi:MAG: PAS domain S-box protein [Thermoleophilia bacterium]|nr:PAS domain S-box protein [Thermoleophilia bacterium]
MQGRGQRLRALIDTLFDAYYDWDIQHGTVDFSAQLGTFLGIAPGRLGTIAAWAERIHPDDRDSSLSRLYEAVREAKVYVDEYRMRRADGTYALIRDRGVPLQDEAGRPVHVVGVMRDATLEREAEQALRESAELYHTLFELAVNPAFHVDQDGQYVNTNHAGASFLESTREELVGQTIATHWAGEALEGMRAVLSDGQSAMRLDAEARVNGSTKAAILTLVPCRVGGNLACFVLATDITERQRLARTLEESNIALRVVLEQRNRSREELERTIAANVESVVLPLLTRVSARIAGTPEAILLDTAVQNLQEIARPFAPGLDSGESGRLTPREREIANLIRAGQSTAEIARALYISPDTVAFHRKNLRRKLRLDTRGTRLASYLAGRQADRR